MNHENLEPAIKKTKNIVSTEGEACDIFGEELILIYMEI